MVFTIYPTNCSEFYQNVHQTLDTKLQLWIGILKKYVNDVPKTTQLKMWNHGWNEQGRKLDYFRKSSSYFGDIRFYFSDQSSSSNCWLAGENYLTNLHRVNKRWLAGENNLANHHRPTQCWLARENVTK